MSKRVKDHIDSLRTNHLSTCLMLCLLLLFACIIIISIIYRS